MVRRLAVGSVAWLGLFYGCFGQDAKKKVDKYADFERMLASYRRGEMMMSGVAEADHDALSGA